MRPGQTSFWQNYEKFFVSQQKSFFGAAATKDNDWAYDYLPKFDVSYDVLKMVDMMAAGQMNGLFCQGLNILMAAPNKAKVATGLAKLKWLVIIDPLETETARFWENHGEFNNVDPKAIQTEVIQLPATAYAEEEGSATNSSRVIMWHWKAADGPGESQERHRDHLRSPSPPARALRQGRRRLPRSDPQSGLELHASRTIPIRRSC